MDFLLAFVIAVVLWPVLKLIYRQIYATEIDPKQFGSWAVVTGATDGIGKAFASYFASKGLNVVLISRSQSKLDNVAAEINSSHKVATRSIQADFTSLDEKMYERIKNELKDLDIGVLVNNVGISYVHPEYFLNLENHHGNLYDDIINCNIGSTVSLCRFVLPGMVTRKRGWIINMSSGLADIPAPLLTLYGASKAFISKFSIDLAVEYGPKNIKVQCLKPGIVATSMSKIKKTSWLVPDTDSYVKSALSDLSIVDNSEGYLSHIITQSLIAFGNFILPSIVVPQLYNAMLKTRAKALKKCENCAEKNS